MLSKVKGHISMPEKNSITEKNIMQNLLRQLFHRSVVIIVASRHAKERLKLNYDFCKLKIHFGNVIPIATRSRAGKGTNVNANTRLITVTTLKSEFHTMAIFAI